MASTVVRVRTRRAVSASNAAGGRRRGAMAGVCYAGLILLVGLAVMVRQFLPDPVAVVVFVSACVVLVGGLHLRVHAPAVVRE